MSLFCGAAKQVGCRACLTQDSSPLRRKGCHLEGVLQCPSKSIPTLWRAEPQGSSHSPAQESQLPGFLGEETQPEVVTHTYNPNI